MSSLSLRLLNKTIRQHQPSKGLLDCEIDDSLLVKNALAGNDPAFKSLVGKYLKPVYNFIFQITGQTSSLDDLTQETFIKAWKNLSRFDQSKNYKVWLYAIARNTAYDYLRKQKTLFFSALDADGEKNCSEEILDDNLLPEELVEMQELEKDLDEKLSKIPKNYALILKMHYKYDFSLAEIAEILKEPYNSVKSRHRRALARLKKEFLT